ncbi:hypothetical protein RHGRI_005317 [Rhododendron griersonianum]|uniref:Exostosin GT47 domain-containing protein n=1 Tax=Rhododendron griersonianum TaxID=479676 RepID=A0AAV6LEA2_9ERIC|nr:hypothetical protein RHGRI_005317 [Rhododendron griersonianum]
MGHKSKVLWQFKARILVWLIVMVFSIWLIDMGQYFELPFGNCITSRFSAGNISSNMTIFNNLNSKEVQRQTVLPENSSSKTNVSAPKGGLKQPAVVVSISEMNDMLLQSRASSFSTKPQWPSAVDQDLQNTRLQIANAPIVVNDPTLYAPLYRNVSMFKSKKNLIEHLKNYLDMIAARHGFWNRTAGADHFLVACHDWALSETNQHMGNCLRSLCNSDVEKGFRFGKDVSLPETSVRSPNNPLLLLGGKPPSQRRILAFFAGSMHGYLRPVLLQHWQDKDPDMKIFGLMRDKVNYVEHMKSSKYCICPKGYEVNSPRVVEAIFYECVPVIISDNFVPPFFDILNWESFAVFVPEKDIPNLKSILLSIPQKKYLEMRKRVKKVQKHFLWHPRPVKYDIFHMILHSIWYNRVFRP